MGRGRAPCCDKSKVKKGPWTPAEDYRLVSFIHNHGHPNWRALPKQAGLLRCGKSCRLRWINYLRPDVKRGNFTPQEEQTIISLHNTLGNKWSKIASHLPGRTDNEIKNVWNTHLKKRLLLVSSSSSSTTKIDRHDAAKYSRRPEIQTSGRREYSLTTSTDSASPSPSSTSCISYGGERSLNIMDSNGPDDDHDQEEGLESKIDLTEEDPLLLAATTMSSSDDKEPPKLQEASHDEQVLGLAAAHQEETSSDHHNMMINCNIANASSDPTNQETKQVVQDGGKDNSNNSIEIINIPQHMHDDADFWNFLEGLDDDSMDIEYSCHDQSQEYYGVHQKEVEYKRWLRYFETELGLAGEGGIDHLNGESCPVLQNKSGEAQHEDLISRRRSSSSN